MSNGLVSILTPCYNCTSFIHRLLDSVLEQDYLEIEMILIDDGSQDNLLDYLNSQKYFQKFDDKGYRLWYFFQQNNGQASAIKNGLQKIGGKYLIWPDSDDYFNSNAIGLMVSSFEIDSSIGIVRCYSNHINEELEFQDTYQGMLNEKEGISNIFLDCLYLSKNMYFGAGNYMVKKENLQYSLKSYNIFEHKLTGQNWQLILPTVYNFSIYTINLKLHNIVEFNLSHSRKKKSLLKEVLTLLAHKNTLLHTLNNIKNLDSLEKFKLKQDIRLKYFKGIVKTVLTHVVSQNKMLKFIK